MITAPITDVVPTANGRYIVRVLCPWCDRIHVHALKYASGEHQAPSCGTPITYWLAVPDWWIGAERPVAVGTIQGYRAGTENSRAWT